MILNFSLKNISNWWLAFVITFVSPLAIWAQSLDDLLPAKFKMVKDMAEITEDGYYLIGSEYSVRASGRDVKGFSLVICQEISSKLVGVPSVYPISEILEEKSASRVWQFRKKEGDKFVLYSPKFSLGVASGKSATDLKLKNEGWVNWKLEVSENNTFLLVKADDMSRALGQNWMPEKVRFGTYKLNTGYSEQLRIYKMVVNEAELPGKAVKPKDGTSVTLISGDKMVITEAGQPVVKTVEDVLLQDGSLAFDAGMNVWTCRHTSNDCFVIEDEQGKGLESIVEGLGPAQEWTINNGHVVTAQTPYRYLVMDNSHRFVLKSMEELSVEPGCTVLFMNVAQKPSYEDNAAGVRVLQGGWSSSKLSSINWDEIYVLDLTHIKLPVHTRNFSNLPEVHNKFIYISSGGKDYCPASWKNVVVCNLPEGNVLQGNLHLYDRVDLVLDREIKIKENQVSYSREAYGDGDWETLCLPFNAKVPRKFQAERFAGFSEADSSLLFEATTTIQANEPVILRYMNQATGEKVHFEVYSNDGVMAPRKMGRDVFCGTFVPMRIGAGGESLFFLKSDGTVFVLASEGSFLAPFRAYLNGNDLKSLHINHPGDNTGVSSVVLPGRLERRSSGCYSIDGRLLYKQMSEDLWDELPHGIYIVNGKKILK